MHYDNEGAKWLVWRIPNARRIKLVQFHCGGNGGNCNEDFMQRVIITLYRGGHVIKTMLHTFRPVRELNPNLTLFAPLEVINF